MPIGEVKMPILAALIKGDPLVNIAGAYFPAWLACVVAGSLATWLLHALAERRGLQAALQPAPLMVPSLFIALTCGFWLVFFSSR